jgi:hypothetical protein
MKYGPYAIRLKYLNEYEKLEELNLSSAGYAIQETSPSILRVYGLYDAETESGDKHEIGTTTVIPLDRVISLECWEV